MTHLPSRIVDLVERQLRLSGITQEQIDRINRPFLEGQIFNLLQRQPPSTTLEPTEQVKVMVTSGAERAFPPPPDLTVIEHLETRRKLDAYINTLTGEILGWIVYPTKKCFSPVTAVHSDPENGPVVVIEGENGWDVFEIDCDNIVVYGTDVAAMAVYFGD